MIIRIEAADPGHLQAARTGLASLATAWGYDLTDDAAEEAAAASAASEDQKIADPVSVAALALSIPPAALAIADLADRIRKRHRAEEVIDQARQQASRQLIIYLITPAGAAELSALTPDQSLDLAADDPAS